MQEGADLNEEASSPSSAKKRKKAANPERRMTVIAHLLELRKRLIYAVVGVGVASILGWYLTPFVTDFIQTPLQAIEGADAQLNFQTLGGAFDLRMRLALWIGTIIASPWWILQIGLFVWPGLKRSERLYALTFGLVGVFLFLGGAYAGLMFAPHAVQILLSFVPEQAAVLLRADSYINFYIALITAFGISFLIPEILVALSFAGVITYKGMLRAWRWAVVISFAFAAFANPIPNPIPMTIQAIVLIALYFLAVLVAYLQTRWKQKKEREKTLTEP